MVYRNDGEGLDAQHVYKRSYIQLAQGRVTW